MKRFKKEELDAMNSLEFAISVLEAEKNRRTNINSPVAQKLALAIAELQERNQEQKAAEASRITEQESWEADLEQAKVLISNFWIQEFGDTQKNIAESFTDLSCIPFAYTELGENNEVPYQVCLDLMQSRVLIYLNYILVEVLHYDSLYDLICNFLDGTDFDDLIPCELDHKPLIEPLIGEAGLVAPDGKVHKYVPFTDANVMKASLIIYQQTQATISVILYKDANGDIALPESFFANFGTATVIVELQEGRYYNVENRANPNARCGRWYLQGKAFGPITVSELTCDQLIQLKQRYLTEQMDESGEIPSWGELADADRLVSDSEILQQYGSCVFTRDDFDSPNDAGACQEQEA